MWSRVGHTGSLLKGLDALPITCREFYGSLLQAVWGKIVATQRAGSSPVKIGLCVSGGADSMCLAYLFRQLHKQSLSPPLDLKAFIIDHKSRHGSTVEACEVARLLAHVGVKSEILTMQWPENVQPGSLPNFETQARLKRYHLLALAATRSGIHDLFLGHHEDDQIETILMRLVRGKSGSMASFWGIAAETPIPVDPKIDSELINFQNPTSEEPLSRNIVRLKLQRPTEHSDSGLEYSKSIKSLDGRISLAPRVGVNLHRPLLKFSKARILATCKANNIVFVSDPTNFDPQITLRNAVRHLRAQYRLPRALSRESVLNIHDRAFERLNHVNTEVQRLFEVAQITSLDLRSGSLTMSLPKFLSLGEWEYSESPVSFLAQVLRLVSPIDDYEMPKPSQQSAASLIFPSGSPSRLSKGASASVTTLAANQVLMTKEVQENHLDQADYVTWRLSRQPFKREQMQRLCRMFVHQPIPDRGGTKGFWSEWMVWDGRYWIRICCDSTHYLQTCTIRAFQASDAADLRTALDRGSRKTLTNLLRDAAPGKVRYTLPVITDDVGVRAFPTLDFAVPEHGRDGIGNVKNKPELLSWEVKYKHIDHRTVQRLIAHASPTDQYLAAVDKCLGEQS